LNFWFLACDNYKIINFIITLLCHCMRRKIIFEHECLSIEGYYAVQGHSRSQTTLVAVESVCETSQSRCWINQTLAYRPTSYISHRFRDIAEQACWCQPYFDILNRWGALRIIRVSERQTATIVGRRTMVDRLDQKRHSSRKPRYLDFFICIGVASYRALWHVPIFSFSNQIFSARLCMSCSLSIFGLF